MFFSEFYQNFKEDFMQILYKLFYKIDKERSWPNLFYEVTVTLIASLHKDYINKENYRSISFMKIDAKLLNKNLQTE